MYFFTWIGGFPQFEILALVIIAFLAFRGFKREAGFLGLALIFEAFLSSGIKNFLQIQRPATSLLLDYSFPSGHAFSSMVLFGFCAYLAFKLVKNKLIKWLIIVACIFLILTIGVSRVYVGDHYLIDVIGGYLLGLLILVVTIYGYESKKI